MSSILSFVKITPTAVLPVRVYVNRRELINSIKRSEKEALFEAAIPSQQTKSHKALIRLKTSTRVYLSNREISKLLGYLKDALIDLIFNKPVPELISQSKKDELVQTVELYGYKCRIITSVKYIQMVRFGGLEGVVSIGTVDCMVRRPVNMANLDPVVLVEDEEERIPQEDEIAEAQEGKRELKYKYENVAVLGNGLSVEVLKRPL